MAKFTPDQSQHIERKKVIEFQLTHDEHGELCRIAQLYNIGGTYAMLASLLFRILLRAGAFITWGSAPNSLPLTASFAGILLVAGWISVAEKQQYANKLIASRLRIDAEKYPELANAVRCAFYSGKIRPNADVPNQILVKEKEQIVDALFRFADPERAASFQQASKPSPPEP